MRRRAAVLLAGVVAVGLVVLVPASPAVACSCVPIEPIDDALADYDLALTGEVTRNEGIDLFRRELDVAVDQVWKGRAAAETELVTHAQGTACGIDPAVGSEVLLLVVRASGTAGDGVAQRGELVVGSCGGQRPVEEAAALGPGRPPDEAETAPSDDPGDTGTGTGSAGDDDGIRPGLLVGLGLLAAAAVGALVVLGRRRAGRDPAT